MRSFYQEKLFLKSLECDYLHIESAIGQTRYQKAIRTLNRGDGSGTSKMITSMMAILVSFLNFILYSSVISMLNPVVVLFLIGLSAINYFALKAARKYEQKNKDKMSELEKKMNYVEDTAKDVQAGKDMRLYSMEQWFLDTREQLLNSYAALSYKIKTRHLLSGIVNAATMLLRDGVAYVYLIWAVTNKVVSFGDFALYFGAIRGFSAWVTAIVGNMNVISNANMQMNDMRAFLECTDAKEPENPETLPELESGVSIEFREVYFSYEKEGQMILKGLNLKINSGEKLALVGVNGAGKTTLVKLLCGFYKPNSGEILINGININDFLKKDLFRLFSAVFQDITILPVSIAENVSMETMDKTDIDKVWDCLKQAGLEQQVEKYPQGIYSQMTRSLDKQGITLSGGQQQKLLMARALYKAAPVLILDEPTAALDPIAESETYEQFHSVSSQKTSIYISHRLASTRFCDRIVFLKDGQIIESGSHTELMLLSGEYANMFEIQSHYYKELEKNEEAICC
jgi:ATP-binding cassette subfamily B protein/ATP-binding cassette subfamily C protein